MRDYGRISPQFWTGATGKKIRQLGTDAQVVALYLMTCPSSNMIGLYYLPIPTLSHETGIPFEGASKALRSLSEAHFAFYDESCEVVWIPEMARFQIGAKLAPRDKRIKGIAKEVEKYRKSRFYCDFYKRYGAAFHLPKPSNEASPFEAPSKPLRSQEQEQEQEHDVRRGVDGAGLDGIEDDYEMFAASVRSYINDQPALPLWDAKQQEGMEKLVKAEGWERANQLVMQGIREKKKWPIAWALGKAQNTETQEAAAAPKPVKPAVTGVCLREDN